MNNKINNADKIFRYIYNNENDCIFEITVADDFVAIQLNDILNPIIKSFTPGELTIGISHSEFTLAESILKKGEEIETWWKRKRRNNVTYHYDKNGIIILAEYPIKIDARNYEAVYGNLKADYEEINEVLRQGTVRITKKYF